MSPRVLVVDDEFEIARAIRIYLEQEGFEVATAGNGREALEQVVIQVPDLVLMDITMPEISGFEVLQHLKANQSTAHVPVVLLTADQSDGSIAIAREAGADAYMTKPFKLDEVATTLRTLLSTQRRRV
jgi:DNA-binding response OmpR family regulator